MRTHVKIAIALLAVGMIATVGWRFAEPIINEMIQADTSDARGKKGTIQIGYDGWIGYFPLCSQEIKKRLYRAGYGLKCTDDNANYKDRFGKLKKGDYHFAVGTVDSYLLNGASFDYPGPVIAVIDESKGGDALVSRASGIATLDDLKASANFRIAFTPDSPSHHLIKAISSHFDIPGLKNTANHYQTDGSEAALEALMAGDVDVAVIWEPEVTKAISAPGIVRLLGTEDTQRLIVDILIASQRTVRSDPELIKLLLKEYFRTLKHYRDHPEELIEDIEDHYSVSKSQATAMLEGVRWATLVENVRNWYGLSSGGYSDEALILSIESAVDILLENDDFDFNPIPDEDSYRLVNSQFVEELNRLFSSQGGFNQQASLPASAGSRFSPLSDLQWDRLETVGSLKTRNIVFVSGTSDLTQDGKRQIDAQMNDLNHYPNFRIEISGHSGLRGDADANLALSQERANSVLRYIEVTHGIDENRVRAKGYGSAQPLKRLPGESARSYRYRLPRVEIRLVRETI